MKTQREMPFATMLTQPRFAPQNTVDSFDSYRDAVVWCWENRVNVGAGEKMDQAMCANLLNLHTPHMSRCVNRDSSAPMNLSPDYLPDFEAFCGWRAVSQFIASKAQMTFMEQVIAERSAACA
jgi:hypothetical protein